MIALVDYGAGNLENVRRGLRRLGRPCEVFSRPEGLEGADLILLPGVGASAPPSRPCGKRGGSTP